MFAAQAGRGAGQLLSVHEHRPLRPVFIVINFDVCGARFS